MEERSSLLCAAPAAASYEGPSVGTATLALARSQQVLTAQQKGECLQGVVRCTHCLVTLMEPMNYRVTH
jgi:hypothetical protein